MSKQSATVPPTLAAPTLAHFQPLVGERFAVTIGEPEPVSIVLHAVTAAPPHALRADPFVLDFTALVPRHLQQGTHRLFHPALGAFDLFLVPVMHHGDGFAYQAIFN